MMVQICEAGRDPCGCDQWKKGIRTINNQYPDDNRDFNINAGDGIVISPGTAGIEIAVSTPFPGPMVFRGTVGTGGTISSLPVANADNLGYVYVAISNSLTPDTPPKIYIMGDEIISNGAEWIVVPSGNDPVDWIQILNKPTTLSGYGITDAVTIDTAQTITGDKQFDGALTKHATTFAEVALKSDRATGNLGGVQSYDSSNKLRTAYSGNAQANNESRAQIYAYDASNSSNRNILTIGFDPNQTGSNKFYSVLANQRDYNSANTGDIVTIGSLASNPSVVHTTGNETIAGTKTFTSSINVDPANGYPIKLSNEHSGNVTSGIIQVGPDSNHYAGLYVKFDSSTNTMTLQMVKIINGTPSVQTVATL